MGFFNSFDISGYGLSAQRFRINIISENIANANTTRTDEGGPYRRKEVIFKAVPFEEQLNDEINKTSRFHKYENPLDEVMKKVRIMPWQNLLSKLWWSIKS